MSGPGPGAAAAPGPGEGPPAAPASVTVPLKWTRIVDGDGKGVVYVSPSGAALFSLDQVREYLQAVGTCKCGLDCPVRPESTFNFDPKVIGKPYDVRTEGNSGDSKSCSFKRKLLATDCNISATANSQVIAQGEKQLKDIPLTKKRKRKTNPYSGISVSQLLAQRENIQQQQQQQQKQLQLPQVQIPQEQFQQQHQQDNQHQQFKDMIWDNSSQICNVNISPHPNHAAPSSANQVRYNNGQAVNNFSNGNMSLTSQPQNSQFIKVENNICNHNEFNGKNNMGPQIVTLNGAMDSQPKLVQQQIMFNGQPNNIIRRTPVLQNSLNNNQLTQMNHILGPNGQIIGIQTSAICRSQSVENISSNVDKFNAKCGGISPISSVKIEQISNVKSSDGKNLSSDKHIVQFPSQNMQFVSNGIIVPSSQSTPQNQLNHCSINISNNANLQQLTPEVIQRINQQQHIFIQQNQKQMELAMKGMKAQNTSVSPQPNTGIRNMVSFNDNNVDNMSSQGALIVTNNPVVLTNQSRMPPWQMNRITKMANNYVQEQQMLANKPNSCQNQSGSAEKSNHLISHAPGNNISNLENQGTVSMQSSDCQNIYSRVPPLHQHTPQSPWSDDVQRKKTKPVKSLKKMRPYNVMDNQRLNRPSQGQLNQNMANIDVRKSSQDNRTIQPTLQMDINYMNNTSSPSFMDDPSGYLAQQTALLNNTISRQVGFNNLCNGNMDGNLKNNNMQMHCGININSNQKSYCSSSGNLGNAEKVNFDNYMNKSDKIIIQSNIPDSSVNMDKMINMQQQNIHCSSCLEKSTGDNSCPHQNMCDQQLQTSNFQTKVQNYIRSISSSKSMTHSQPGTPSPNQSSDESPVTSSTYMERPGSRSNGCSDLRGPIQGGIISTSNGSPVESFALPELSPTPSNCSRNTDTPQSKNSGCIHISSSCPYTIPSPAYSNQGSSRESVGSNPATPSPGQNNTSYITYSSPGPVFNQSSNQMINNEMSNSFNIRSNNSNESNLHNIMLNSSTPSNMMVSEHVSMHPDQTQSPTLGTQRRYYMSPHVNSAPNNLNQDGQMMFINTNGMVTTMASGHTLSRNTITSVLAGKAQTATTSINASASTLPFSYPLTNTENITSSNLQVANKNIQFENINVPPDYPVHVAGNLPQNLISKTPLEMVQSVVSSIQVSQSQNCTNVSIMPQQSSQFQNKNPANNNGVQSGQILIPPNGQFLVANGNQTPIMAPPPPKGQSMTPLPPLSTSPLVTTVTASVSQGIPAVGGVQQVINQPTVLVNTLPAPFMLPQVMTVEGQVVNQNVQMPQIVTGNIISQGRIVTDGNNTQDVDRNSGLITRPNLISPDSGKKKGKKRKSQNQPVTSMLQITAQHSPGSVLVQHNSQQQQQQFSPQGFQVSPNTNMSTTPMLQALTIVPGKPGTPAHIVMNGQGTNGNFGSQQIITNSQGPQHINLLQPVNLLNNTGVVQNFPTFQQFIVPGLGSMVMTADGTAILQDTSSVPMQLQIQNVNGQNVLTPVQNQGILTAGTAGMVIRTQNPNNKMIQSQHSPGAQFLSPTGGQIVMSGSPFNGQLSPMVANVSPNHSVTFNTSPPQVRPNIQQEFIQCNQMGQALMLPLSPNQIAISTSPNQQNTTFVQQNTTIVQQQTTMVSNNHSNNQFQNGTGNSNNNIVPSLNIDQGVIINQGGKTNSLMKGRHNMIQMQNQNSGGQLQPQHITIHNPNETHSIKKMSVHYPQIVNQIPQTHNNIKNESHVLTNINQNNMNQQFQNGLHPNVRHSVSTQTFVNQQNNDSKSSVAIYNQQISGSSPPDTTTHSPLGVLESSSSPANSLSGRSSNSSQGNQVDTTTGSPEPNEHGSLPMVHCVSSSEPDSGERDNNLWGRNQNDNIYDMHGNAAIHHHFSNPGQNAFHSIDSSSAHFNSQTISVPSINNLQNLNLTPANYFQKSSSGKLHNPTPITPTNSNNQQFFEKITIKNSCMMNNLGLDQQNYRKQIMSIHDNCEKNISGADMQRNCNDVRDIGNGNYMKRNSISGVNDASNEESTTPSNPDDLDDNLTSIFKQLKEGDLVWGPAKGYPAWPGKLVSKNIVNGICDGKVLVRWFGGDKCLSAVDPVRLQTLSEGLEAHHAARTKCRKSRKLNSQLENAIQEAMAELDRIAESSESNDNKDVNALSDSHMGENSFTADINGNSNKTLNIPSNTGINKNVNDGRNKPWSLKKEALRHKNIRTGVVKIAPHPITGNEVSGRLRSSNR